MQSYHDPQVYNVQNPTGVDYAIAKLQAKLSALPFLDTIYGRAYVQSREETPAKTKPAPNRLTIFFPETWGKNYEPVNCMPNDNIPSYCFFVLRDPGTRENETNILPTQISLRQPISIIFWFNLKKVDPTKPWRYSEELKKLLLYQVTREASFEFDASYERYDRVYEGFTLTDTYKQYIKPPYWAIRIDGSVNYDALPTCFDPTMTPTNVPIPPQYPYLNDFLPYRVVLRVGIDTTTLDGNIITPNAGTLTPPWENTPNLNLKLSNLIVFSDMHLGGAVFQDYALVNGGNSIDFKGAAGDIQEGLITFYVRKKMIYP